MGRPAKNYNNLMVFNSGVPDSLKGIGLSSIEQRLCHRAVEAFYYGPKTKRANRKILITGEHGGSLDEDGRIERGGMSMAAFVLQQYSRMTPEVLLLGVSSTDIEESFVVGRDKYPEFFEKVTKGEQRLGIVSTEERLAEAVRVGSWALKCDTSQFVRLPVRELLGEEGGAAAFEEQDIDGPYVALAADE